MVCSISTRSNNWNYSEEAVSKVLSTASCLFVSEKIHRQVSEYIYPPFSFDFRDLLLECHRAHCTSVRKHFPAGTEVK